MNEPTLTILRSFIDRVERGEVDVVELVAGVDGVAVKVAPRVRETLRAQDPRAPDLANLHLDPDYRRRLEALVPAAPAPFEPAAPPVVSWTCNSCGAKAVDASGTIMCPRCGPIG